MAMGFLIWGSRREFDFEAGGDDEVFDGFFGRDWLLHGRVFLSSMVPQRSPAG